jgi:glycosyltransferase involved in cell wall biosynthesis
MRIVIINETFSPKMGYIGSMLPKYLAREGTDVHVLTTDLPAYYNLGEFRNTVPEFLASQGIPVGSVHRMDGYTVHVQPHGRALGYVFMHGMYDKLRELRPDVVYSILAIGWLPLQAALLKHRLNFRFFTGSHTSALSFPLARSERLAVIERLRAFCLRWLPGRFVSLHSEKCYCPTADCGEVAWRFFGVQRAKVDIVHLGVDPEFFFPLTTEVDYAERLALRRALDFSDRDVVCIYTGKMTQAKNPLLLAQAIQQLRSEGRSFRGLFLGEGAQRAVVAKCEGSVVLDFVELKQLGQYYRAADVAVWPTNESTSMLDAAACGLPLVVSDRIYQDHVTGNGIAYRMNDLADLCNVLRGLDDPEKRHLLGSAGAKKMRDRFSWELAAKKRMVDFGLSLAPTSGGSVIPRRTAGP